MEEIRQIIINKTGINFIEKEKNRSNKILAAGFVIFVLMVLVDVKFKDIYPNNPMVDLVYISLLIPVILIFFRNPVSKKGILLGNIPTNIYIDKKNEILKLNLSAWFVVSNRFFEIKLSTNKIECIKKDNIYNGMFYSMFSFYDNDKLRVFVLFDEFYDQDLKEFLP